MAVKRKPRPKLSERTPIAEWVAAALGLALTLTVVGYLVADGLGKTDGPPELTVAAERPQAAGGTFVVPVVVSNAADATAAAVEVRGALVRDGRVVEERRASFAYVPGRGEARGGLVFQNDPRSHELNLWAEGYEDP